MSFVVFVNLNKREKCNFVKIKPFHDMDRLLLFISAGSKGCQKSGFCVWVSS